MNTTAYGMLETVAKRMRMTWAPGARATVAVAEDPAHALELLQAGSGGGCAAVLFYLSDGPEGEEMPEDTRVDALLRVAVVQRPGLARAGQADAPPVLVKADLLRAWAARETFGELLDGRLEYRGMTHIPATAGSALNGYALTFGAVYAYETEG